MKMAGLALVLGASLVGLVACEMAGFGSFGTTGYHHPKYAYELDFRRGSTAGFLPDEWSLDNWVRSEDGMKQLETPKFMATYERDDDEDGEVSEHERHREPRQDLRFVNVRHDGVMWLKAIPLTSREARRDLDLFVADAARELNGGHVSLKVHPDDGVVVHRTDVAAVMTECIRGRVAGHDAAAGLIDVGGPRGKPTSRLRLTVIRFEFLEPLAAYQTSSPWPIVQRGAENCARKTALLLVGYSNSVARFAEGEADYAELLRQIRIDGRRGGFEPLPSGSAAVGPVGSTI